jgi:hypothetical protein
VSADPEINRRWEDERERAIDRLVTEPPTAVELTRAWYLSLHGDAKMTGEERAFVRDVIQRDNLAALERSIQLYEWLTAPHLSGPARIPLHVSKEG